MKLKIFALFLFCEPFETLHNFEEFRGLRIQKGCESPALKLLREVVESVAVPGRVTGLSGIFPCSKCSCNVCTSTTTSHQSGYAALFCTIGRFEEQDELHQDDFKKRMNSSYSSKLSWCKIG